MIRLDVDAQVHAIMLAADAECKAQTPPNGGKHPAYICPSCAAQRNTRAEFRTHMNLCDRFGAEVLALRSHVSMLIS